jgi:hypothetical protein
MGKSGGVERMRVVIAVEPKLFGEALARALQREDVDVIDLTDSPPAGLPPLERRFDVALTSGSLPGDLDVHVVIELPETPGKPGTGTVRRAGDAEDVELEDLDALIELVERVRPRGVAGSA